MFKHLWQRLTNAIAGEDSAPNEWSIWIRVRPEEPAYVEVIPPSGNAFVTESPTVKDAIEKIRCVYEETKKGSNEDMDAWPA